MLSATEAPFLVETQATFALTNFSSVADLLLASVNRPPLAICHLSLAGGAGTSAARLTVSGSTGGLGGGGGGTILVAPVSPS